MTSKVFLKSEKSSIHLSERMNSRHCSRWPQLKFWSDSCSGKPGLSNERDIYLRWTSVVIHVPVAGCKHHTALYGWNTFKCGLSPAFWVSLSYAVLGRAIKGLASTWVKPRLSVPGDQCPCHRLTVTFSNDFKLHPMCALEGPPSCLPMDSWALEWAVFN